MKSLKDIAKEKLCSIPREALEPFATQVLNETKDKAQGLVVYGSCLSQVTASSTSTPDFFVLVRRYRDFHASLLHRFLNWILPPSIYHFDVRGVIAKYNVIRVRDLALHVTGRKDLYNLGRFSKRIGILWARDEEIEREIIEIHIRAMKTVANFTLSLMRPSFTLDEFIRQALFISYIGDIRVEADNKAEKLFAAEKEYYRQMYGTILREFSQQGLLKEVETEKFERCLSPMHARWRRWKLWFFLKKSRLTALLRWPKGIITVEHWIDYLLAKIERTKGIDLNLTENEKRYWYIYGWKYLYRLKRDKMLK